MEFYRYLVRAFSVCATMPLRLLTVRDMVGQWASRTFVTQFGANHWKVVTGRDFGVRVEPRRLYGLAGAILGITVAFISAVWLSSAIPLEGKIILSAVGVAAGVMLAAFFVLFDRSEQSRGSYLVVNREGIYLRHGFQVLLEDFAAFEVSRSWRPTGDGEALVASLVLRTKGGEQFEILASVCARDLFELKRVLEENISRILAVKSGAVSSGD